MKQTHNNPTYNKRPGAKAGQYQHDQEHSRAAVKHRMWNGKRWSFTSIWAAVCYVAMDVSNSDQVRFLILCSLLLKE